MHPDPGGLVAHHHRGVRRGGARRQGAGRLAGRLRGDLRDHPVGDPGRPALTRRATAARTRVGGADQLEARRHRHPVVLDTTDHDATQLERLAQTVEHGLRELAHLVEEEHATVGE